MPTYQAIMCKVDEFLWKNVRLHSGRILHKISDNIIEESQDDIHDNNEDEDEWEDIEEIADSGLIFLSV